MTTFDQRERAFETKFVHEQDLNFRACAARNKRIAFWAAEQIGMPVRARPGYAAEIVRCGAAGGDEAVFERLRSDLRSVDHPVSDHRLRRRMTVWLAEALSAQYPAAMAHDALAALASAKQSGSNEDRPAFSLLREYFSHTRSGSGSARIKGVVAATGFLGVAYALILLGNTLSVSAPYNADLEIGSSALTLAFVAAGVWARRRNS